MIDRYSLPEMAKIWEEKTKYKNWIRVEKSLIDALLEVKFNFNSPSSNPPNEYLQELIDEDIMIEEIIQVSKEKELETKHDLAAFVDVLSMFVEGKFFDSRWIHYGLTSSDVLDSAFSLQILQAIDSLEIELNSLLNTLKHLAIEHKFTPQIGRTHGQSAEPITLGVMFLNYYAEFVRQHERLMSARENIRVGKLSGAVGISSHLPFEVEEIALKKLGLKVAPVSTQILQRDRHAQVFNTLALIGCSLEKLATQIRLMQRSDCGEIQEGFTAGQKGSSAMSQKRNPIASENICGLARLLRGYAQSAMEDVCLFDLRDMSHSSVERIIAPDAFGLLYFMVKRMNGVLCNLVINVNEMAENIYKNDNLWLSQTIMLKMISNGLERDRAYKLVQKHINKRSFIYEINRDEDIKKYLGFGEVKEFLLFNHFKGVDNIFERVLGEK